MVRVIREREALDPIPKIRLIFDGPEAVPDIKLIRTDTTLDLSH